MPATAANVVDLASYRAARNARGGQNVHATPMQMPMMPMAWVPVWFVPVAPYFDTTAGQLG